MCRCRNICRSVKRRTPTVCHPTAGSGCCQSAWLPLAPSLAELKLAQLVYPPFSPSSRERSTNTRDCAASEPISRFGSCRCVLLLCLQDLTRPTPVDHQVYIYTLPSLDQIPPTVIKPIRNVVAIAVDEQHIRRTPPLDPAHPADPIDLCVIKRNAIALYSLFKERLFFQKVCFQK